MLHNIQPLSVLAISGSLRSASYNRKALQLARKIAEEWGAHVEEIDLRALAIPLYDGDIEAAGFPEIVLRLKAAVEAAHVLLVASPEYNHSIPGVLKNAIDWASRPYGDNAWDGKPVAIMGASIGMLGTARAQYHLRQSCVFLNMFPLNQPEVMIANASQRFDQDGNLTDQHTRDKIGELLQALAVWTRRLKIER